MQFATTMLATGTMAATTMNGDGRVRYNHQATASDYQHPNGGVNTIEIANVIQPWNMTQGPPPRGWYKAKFNMEFDLSNTLVIKKSGDMMETKDTFDFTKYGKDHYCRYRNDDEGENEGCCNAEDQNCYTQAGCFCDTACFTTYGDCCTDHYVTCYDDLGLCLKKFNTRSADDVENIKGVAQQKNEKSAVERAQMENDANANFGIEMTKPEHIEPNACCGNAEFNNAVKCCVYEGGRKFLKPMEQCEAEEEEEEGGVDERIVYDDEELEE